MALPQTAPLGGAPSEHSEVLAMTNAATAIANKPAWVDLGTQDAAGAREFYSTLFGWDIHVSPDPQYGGYGRALLDGKDAAGIGPAMSPEQPTAWSLYIGTDDVDALAGRIQAAGGNVIMAPFDVGDQGRMAFFADPGGAVISAWQPISMGGFQTQGTNGYGWAELNARGVAGVIPFYQDVFGWDIRQSDMGGGQGLYTEFLVDGESIAGAAEMSPMAPAEMPNYWLVYFAVDEVDAATKKAVAAGGQEMLAPMDFPGGRMSMVTDPQGGILGLLKLSAG
jgi:predicted enzyme related to lactoylglutathione lyase